MDKRKIIITSGQRWDRQTGWQETTDMGMDDIRMNDYTEKTLPEETAEWIKAMLFDDLDEDEIWDYTQDLIRDYKVWAELVDEDDKWMVNVWDSKSYWVSQLARDYLADRLGLDRDTIDLACAILALDYWDADLNRDLCIAAGMESEWDSAEPGTTESVVIAAAEKLGVRIA